MANAVATQNTAAAPAASKVPNPPNPAQTGGKQAVLNPNPAAQNPAAVQAEIRKLKLILDGKNLELPESEVIRLAQKGIGADKRFGEAAVLRKQAEEILKADPIEFFKRAGKDGRQWAENFLLEQIKLEQMSPEQKEAHDNKMKLQQMENERKLQTANAAKQEQEAERIGFVKKYDAIFTEALGKVSLPKTAYTVKRMAELQATNLKNKLNLDADQLAKVVREDYMAERTQLYGGMEGEQLLEMVGTDIVKKIQKALIAKLKAKGSAGSSRGVKLNPNQNQGGEPQGLTWQEYRRRNRQLR